MQGFINVFKPANMSSAKVVAKIKHKFNLKKVGHMGTLDPLACGILPIAVGKATRMFDYFLNKKKTYETIIKFGVTTNSLDSDGIVTQTSKVIPTKEQIEKVLPSFVGKQEQMPPNFSAKKVNGQKAYALARSGVQFELTPKTVEIFSFTLLNQVDACSFAFNIECSSGTYIRSIARDLGEKLNTCAMLTYLERTKSDNFTKENCVQLEELLNSNISNYLINITEVFNNFEILNVSEEECSRLKNGLSIKRTANCKQFFISCNNILLGVGENSENNVSIKTYLLEE